MNRTTVKYVGIALIVGGLILSTTGLGAFSALTANRQMFVGVGGESTSYLGISTGETTVTTNGTNGTQRESGWQGARYSREAQSGTEVVLGEVTNYFPTKLDSIQVSVSETSGPITVNEAYVEDGALPLRPGEKPANLMAIVDCSGGSSGTVTLTFEATGIDTHVTTERTVPVTCVNGSSSAPSNSPRLLPSPRQVSSGLA